jgi:hypothetical protein
MPKIAGGLQSDDPTVRALWAKYHPEETTGGQNMSYLPSLYQAESSGLPALYSGAASARGLVPYSQGWPGPGFRLVMRRATRGSAARAAGFYFAKSRRMNVCNVHALRRAARRVEGFAALARRLITFTHTHRIKGVAHKRRRR